MMNPTFVWVAANLLPPLPASGERAGERGKRPSHPLPRPAPRPTAGFAQPAGSGGAKHASRIPSIAPPAGEGEI